MTTAVAALSALIAAAEEQMFAAEKRGDNATADTIFAKLIRPLNTLRKQLALAGLAAAAQALDRASEAVEAALRDVQRSVDAFLLDGLRRQAAELGLVRRGGDEAAASSRAPDILAAPIPAPGDGPDDAPGPVPTTEEAYARAFTKMQPSSDKWIAAAEMVAAQIADAGAAARYRRVSLETGVPWWLIGSLHVMESGSFDRHLHNGDPLARPTMNHPAGRPRGWVAGQSWEASAIDALTIDTDIDAVTDWTIGRALLEAEKWNGTGYRSHGIWTPYVWSGSDYYRSGKFVADRTFEPTAVSKQVGVAMVLRSLVARGAIEAAKPRTRAARAATAERTVAPALPRHVSAELAFVREIRHGDGIGAPPNGPQRMAVRRVQEWCKLHGIDTRVDGEFGDGTLAAVRAFQARHALPQNGAVDEATWTLLVQPMAEALATVDLIELGAQRPSLPEMTIRVARAHLAKGPREVGGNNRGPWVRLYMEGAEELPWCAGFACFIAAQAAKDLGIAMPFARQVGVDRLVTDAQANQRFIAEHGGGGAESAARVPIGGFFVRRKSSNDWDHTGIVTSADADVFRTIEGNTTGEDRDGDAVKASHHRYADYDFIRLI